MSAAIATTPVDPTSGHGSAEIRIGIVGLGAAGRAFLPAIKARAGMRLVAVADPVQEIRDSLAATHGATAYAGMEALLAHPGLDAVYIATPTDLHFSQVMQACAAKKHVLVEKPMATSLNDARHMVEAAERAGIQLVVGHSHSYDLPIKRMRELIAGGSLGRVRMINTWCFTDWIHRPRRPEELDSKRGGGVTYRQGSHQFDIIRLIGGGLVKTVRARTFDWDPARQAIGAHVAYLDFEDGTAATAVYNGYGRFSSMDLCFDITEWGALRAPAAPGAATRHPTAMTPEAELQAKQQRARTAIPTDTPFQPFFGLTLVSCERGEIRQSPRGLYVSTDTGREEIILPTDRSPRDLVIAEFDDAIRGTARPLHDGKWSLASFEICVAAIASSDTGRDVDLQYQVAVP